MLVQQISCHKLTLDHEQNFNFSSFCRFDSTAKCCTKEQFSRAVLAAAGDWGKFSLAKDATWFKILCLFIKASSSK